MLDMSCGVQFTRYGKRWEIIELGDYMVTCVEVGDAAMTRHRFVWSDIKHLDS